MKRSLTKCQFVAFAAGLVLCAVLTGIWLGSLPFFGGYVIVPLDPSVREAACFLAASVFAFGIARYAGKYDRVAFITCAVAASAVFLWGYLGDISSEIEANYRGCINRESRPFDFFGQLGEAWYPALWGIAAACAGMGLNRLMKKREPVVANAKPSKPIFWWFASACCLLVVLGLLGFASRRMWENSPEGLLEKGREMIPSPKASVYEKSSAIADLGSVFESHHSSYRQRADAADLLRGAMAVQPPPLDRLAAAFLLAQGDTSGFYLLKDDYMRSGVLRAGWVDLSLVTALKGFSGPDSVPILVGLMGSQVPGVRRGATDALGRFRGREAEAALLGGLENPDPEVRWLSVRGLAEMAGKDAPDKSRPPSKEGFFANEQCYVGLWRNWAESRPVPEAVSR